MSTNELRRIANDIEDDGYEASATLIGSAADLIDAITKDLGLPEGSDFAVVRVRGMAQRAALQEWVDYFDSLDRDAEPGDPLVAIRLRVHGPRMARSRAALAKTDALGGPAEVGEGLSCVPQGGRRESTRTLPHLDGPGGKEQPNAEAQEGDWRARCQIRRDEWEPKTVGWLVDSPSRTFTLVGEGWDLYSYTRFASRKEAEEALASATPPPDATSQE